VAASRSTGGAHGGVRSLRISATGMQNGSPVVDSGMDARKAFALCEATEIAAMRLHPITKFFPQGSCFLIRKWSPIYEHDHDD